MNDDRAIAQRLLVFLDHHERVPAGSMIRLGPLWSCARCHGSLVSATSACAACGEVAAHLPRLSCTCGKPLFHVITGTLYDQDHYAEGEVGAAECASCGRIAPLQGL
jgi:hypothetical protein